MMQFHKIDVLYFLSCNVVFLLVMAWQSCRIWKLKYEIKCKEADIQTWVGILRDYDYPALKKEFDELKARYEALSQTYEGLTNANLTPIQQLHLWHLELEEIRESTQFKGGQKERFIRNMENAITDLQKTVKDPGSLIQMIKSLPRNRPALLENIHIEDLFKPVNNKLNG